MIKFFIAGLIIGSCLVVLYDSFTMGVTTELKYILDRQNLFYLRQETMLTELKSIRSDGLPRGGASIRPTIKAGGQRK